MSSNALARLGEEEGKCWAFGESCRVVPAEVAREVVVALQAERDALAAKLKDLEGQEPVSREFQDRDGKWCGFIDDKHYQNTVADGSWPIRDLFARPVPIEPVNVEFGMHGETMFFKIGNQQFDLDYKPEEPGEFEFMKDMLLSAIPRITHGVKTASEPVNETLLEVLKTVRNSLRDHPEYAQLSEEQEEEIGGDTAEFSYLVRVIDGAIESALLAKKEIG